MINVFIVRLSTCEKVTFRDGEERQFFWIFKRSFLGLELAYYMKCVKVSGKTVRSGRFTDIEKVSVFQLM